MSMMEKNKKILTRHKHTKRKGTCLEIDVLFGLGSRWGRICILQKDDGSWRWHGRNVFSDGCPHVGFCLKKKERKRGCTRRDVAVLILNENSCIFTSIHTRKS